MRISDWSSDVCSSDLLRATLIQHFSRSPTQSEYPVMNAKGFAAVACLGLMPALAQAAPWSGDVALCYLATTGNSKTSSLNGKFSLIYAQERWKNTLSAAAINTYADNESSAESYAANEQLDYNFTTRDYASVAVEWNKDLFAAIRKRTSETAGYGRSEEHRSDPQS